MLLFGMFYLYTVVNDFEFNFRFFLMILFVCVLCFVRQLVSAMSVLDTTSSNLNKKMDKKIVKSRLRVKFGQSLRLLSFQDIMMLLQVCVDKNIDIPEIANMNVIDFENAISNSVSQRKDCRLLEHACDARGTPYLMTFCDFDLPTRIHCLMMFELLECDLDINLVDYASGETVIFSLLRKYDYITLRYLLTRHKETKKIAIFLNYYNNQGISPLYLALSLYRKEKRLFSRFDVNDHMFMYQYLLQYGANPNDSLKKGEYISCLGYAMKEIKDPNVCAFWLDFVFSCFSCKDSFRSCCFCQLIQDLLDRGCVLNVRELRQLSLLYIENAMKDEKVQLKGDGKSSNANGNNGDEIGLLTNIIKCCNMIPSSICDEFQNNPLHLYVTKHQSRNNGTKEDVEKAKEKNERKYNSQQLIEAEKHIYNDLRLLVRECPDWLYQRNIDNDTPLSLTMKLGKTQLLPPLLMSFDGDKKKDDSDIGVVDVNNNKSRYDDILLILANDKQIAQSLYQLIVKLCNEILKSKMRTMSVNVDELKKYIDNNEEENMAANEFVIGVLNDMNCSTLRFLTCDVESQELEEYINLLPKDSGSAWLKLKTVLHCYDFIGASIVGGLNFAAFCRQAGQMHVIQFVNQFFNFDVTDDNVKQVKSNFVNR